MNEKKIQYGKSMWEKLIPDPKKIVESECLSRVFIDFSLEKQIVFPKFRRCSCKSRIHLVCFVWCSEQHWNYHEFFNDFLSDSFAREHRILFIQNEPAQTHSWFR